MHGIRVILYIGIYIVYDGLLIMFRLLLCRYDFDVFDFGPWPCFVCVCVPFLCSPLIDESNGRSVCLLCCTQMGHDDDAQPQRQYVYRHSVSLPSFSVASRVRAHILLLDTIHMSNQRTAARVESEFTTSTSVHVYILLKPLT